MIRFDLSGLREILEYYAELKEIPLSKVLRNAAKDFVQAAYGKGDMTTPVAEKIAKKPWALVPGKGSMQGKGVYVRLDSLDAKAQRRLEKFRLAKPMRGFARSMFIPVMRELEFKQKKPPQAAPLDKIRRGFSFYAHKSADAFAADIEGERARRQAAGRREPYSQRRIVGDAAHPGIEVTIREPSLSLHPEWQENAAKKGYALASQRLARDLIKTIRSKHPKMGVPNSNI